MLTVTRILEFDAAHRVMNHESKCATLHGHRYKIEIEATAPELDAIGRVIDFSVLKEKIGSWMDLNWDHNSILYRQDKETVEALSGIPRRKPPFIADWNPTAENMAQYLLKKCPELLGGTDVHVSKITVWETPNCYAVASYD